MSVIFCFKRYHSWEARKKQGSEEGWRGGCSLDWNERRKALAAAGGRWGGKEWRGEVRRGRDRLSAELAIALGGGSSAPPQPQHQQERGRRSG